MDLHPYGTGAAIWPDVARFLPDELLAEIAVDAPTADLDGRPAAKSLELLRTADWPGLPVPSEFQGRGATLQECCAGQLRLATADPALAIAVNMHLFSVGLMVEHWRRRTDVSWLLLEAIAAQRRLLASAFAEPNLGGSVSRSTLLARPAPDGYLVSGTKRPCSLAAEADLVSFQVEMDTGRGRDVMVALLPTNAPGLTVQRSWDALGMRGSGSDTLVFTDCHVPEELVFYRAPAGDEDDDVLAAGVVWFSLTASACYLGVARAAVSAARQLLARGVLHHLGVERARVPSYQGVVGAQVASLLTLEAACAQLAGQLDAGVAPQAVLPACLAVKQQTMDVVPAAVGALAEACGGVAYSRLAPLERLWRDAQAVRFHPPTRLPTLQYLGRSALGLPAHLDLDENAPRLTEELARTGEGE
ncbi:acyl-CoA dehydrogenase family protein [Micromonospora sp. C95]|uniref:acyl-CoA dehydrogenase family protein n=1 Tax=Micromonospora sp. C95 TaxID=2824882 RepID=UPI001B36AA4B|nr:acyl-CoA dehydrogenase family protein [Micromonospora sp. C95]MBQ1026026.1 acyl-CoA/acyl-ACP dehydrogenase [Micromonospora sp. C95]